MRLIWGEITGLRRFEERMTDAEMHKLYEWSNDEEVLRWSGGSPTALSESEFREHLHGERLYGPTNRRAFLIFATPTPPRNQTPNPDPAPSGRGAGPGAAVVPHPDGGGRGLDSRAREPLTLIGRLGIFGIDWDKGQGELGIVIGEKDYWGRGYGRDAVRTLVHHLFTTSSLERIYLYTFANNLRAQRSFAAAGFRTVDHGRRFTPDVGEFEGVQMEIMRGDFVQEQIRQRASLPRDAD